MSAPTLKDQLLALCDEHGLRSLSIGAYTLGDGTRFFGATAHGGDRVGTNDGLEQDISRAIADAIENLNSKRYISPVIAELVAA